MVPVGISPLLGTVSPTSSSVRSSTLATHVRHPMTHVYNWFRPLLTLFAVLLCAPAALVAQDIIFEDDFESGSLGPAWTARPNIDGGSNGIVEPRFEVQGNTNIGFDGSIYTMVMGKTTDLGGNTTNALDLSLDLTGRTDVELSFWMYSFNEGTDPEDGIYFSDNGGSSFTKVYDFDGDSWSGFLYGQLPPFDVDQLAADNGLTLNDQFVIRWQQRDAGDFVDGFRDAEDGLYIDDVIIRSNPIVYATLPFEDGFESGEFGDSWRRKFASNTIGTTRLGGFAEVRDRVGNDTPTPANGNFAAVLGRRNVFQPTTNALDLHLDLSGETDVELLYRLLDFNDETQPQDAIWFSDDGGATFSRVFSLDGDNWNGFVYGQLPPLDVDQLAADNGLTLTDRFVIRFQQHDQGDFIDAFRDAEDGFFIDDVLVRRTPTVHVSLPFRDGFEAAPFGDRGLGSAWSVGFAEETTPPGVTRLGGLIDESTFQPRTGTYGARLGRRNDGSETTNALDLHLDLTNQTNVALRYWIADFIDETQERDGIWFSDDGGATYVKVLQIDPESIPDLIYERFTVDVADLANANGLVLSENFVIRIQQNDGGDFINNFGDAEDGFLIDDVAVLSLDAQQDVVSGTSTVDLTAEAGLSIGFTTLTDDTELLVAQDPTDTVEGIGLPPIPDDMPSDPLLLAQPHIWTTILEPTPGTVSADLCFGLENIPAPADPAQWTVYQFGEDGAWTEAASVELRPNDTAPTQICALGTNGQGDFAVVSRQSVLPVELSAFTAALEGDEAVLVWTTASEENNAGFDVERSLDGGAFERLGFVEGAGTTETARQYRFTDRALPFDTDVAAYRLRQIDTDGTVAVSDEVRVRRSAPDALIFHSPFPNPARDRATVRYEMPKAGPVRLALYNVLGQQVWGVSDEEARAGRIEYRIPTTNLVSGLYFLRLETAQGTQTQRLSVVR